jgi:hypothetical protein
MLAGNAISWGSKLLPSVAAPTVDTVCMASACGAKEAIWLQKLMTTLQGEKGADDVMLHCDNQEALALLRNPTSHQRATNNDVAHHFMLEREARGGIKVLYRPTRPELDVLAGTSRTLQTSA